MFQYQVGDKIAFETSRGHFMPAIDTVAKVTKTQVTTTRGRKFSLTTEKELKSEANSYPIGYLLAVDYVEKSLAEKEEAKCNEQTVQELLAVLAGRRRYSGKHSVSAEEVEAIRALTALLTK
jgi:hypothetical protein